MTPKQQVGKNVRTLREMFDLTRDELARKAKISSSGLRDIEDGVAWMSDKTALSIGGAINVPWYVFYSPKPLTPEHLLTLLAKSMGIEISIEKADSV